MLQAEVATVDSIIVFIISLLIGALGLYIGARVISNVHSYTYAIITALIGALIYAMVAFIVPFGWLGLVLALIAYLAVINWQYPGGWGEAIGIAVVAWVAVVIVMWILGTVGVVTPEATGIPFI